MQRYNFSLICTTPQTNQFTLSRTHARARHARHDFQTRHQSPFLYFNIEKTLKPDEPDFTSLKSSWIIALPQIYILYYGKITL